MSEDDSSAAAAAAELKQAIRCKMFVTKETSWDPKKDLKVSMNVRVDGCIVPDVGAIGARVGYSHVVVLDDFVSSASREALLNHLVEDDANGSMKLRDAWWDRKTTDMDGSKPTWGVTDACVADMYTHQKEEIIEIQSRLSKLYPEFDIAYMPEEYIQESNGQGGNCASTLVNAAVQGDEFVYHVDADPASFPSGSSWTQEYGEYFNGQLGKPLLVSLIIYLNDEWKMNDAADTLILDTRTDTGCFIRPKAGRAVLMHQDIVHRLSAPSATAQGKPRLSIVWKLMFIPKQSHEYGGYLHISKKEFGHVCSFGSAARVDSVLRGLLHDGTFTKE